MTGAVVRNDGGIPWSQGMSACGPLVTGVCKVGRFSAVSLVGLGVVGILKDLAPASQSCEILSIFMTNTRRVTLFQLFPNLLSLGGSWGSSLPGHLVSKVRKSDLQ